MHTRSRLVFGSLAGALSIHLVMVACSSGGAPPSSDAGHDAGLLADVRDAIVDVVNDVLDAETRDAIAGGDGGVATDGGAVGGCRCIPTIESSFGLTVNRGRGAEAPVARFSSATVSVSLAPGRGGVDGPPAVRVNALVGGYLRDGTSFSVACIVLANLDGSVIQNPTANGCVASFVNAAGESVPIYNPVNVGVLVPVLMNDRVELRVQSVSGFLMRPDGPDAGGERISVDGLVIRANSPGSRWLDELQPAYRP